jgi:disulfide bond formation protein DsbB
MSTHTAAHGTGASAATRAPSGAQVDPRGQQFAAAVTSVVLAVVLLGAPSPIATALLAVQAVLFAIGAGLGVQSTPHALVFRTLLRPRLGAPRELEDATPPRFAQTVGLVFAVVGLAGFLTGATVLGLVATGFALVAALLNAVFGFCLGCEMYLLIKRLAPSAG